MSRGPTRTAPGDGRCRAANGTAAWTGTASWFSPELAVRGEATPGYMSPRFDGTADRMHQVVPEAKLIACVRDPVARALSHFRQSTDDWYESRTLDEAMQPDGFYVRSSRYAELLEPYLEHWSIEDIHIVSQEDLLADRRATLAGAFRFLGVAPDFWSPVYEELLNVSARKSGAPWRVLQWLRRRRGWHHVGDRAPRALLPAIDRLTSASPETQHVDGA